MTQISPTNYEPDPVEFTRDRVPDFGEDQEGELKQKYLTYRVFDFGKGDAAGLCKLDLRTVHRWREQDARFKAFEDEELPKLRRDIQTEATLSEFYRNMWLILQMDRKVLIKAAVEGIPALQASERDYLFRIRGRYGMDNLLAMLKIAAGDLGSGTTNNLFVETIFISGPGGERIDKAAD